MLKLLRKIFKIKPKNIHYRCSSVNIGLLIIPYIPNAFYQIHSSRKIQEFYLAAYINRNDEINGYKDIKRDLVKTFKAIDK